MARSVHKLVAVFAVGAIALAMGFGTEAGAAPQGKKEDKVAAIDEVMKKVCNPKKGLVTKVNAAAKDGKWEDAAKDAKSVVSMGADLGKNPCPKGDKESWEKLTKKFATATKAIGDAVEKKDAEATTKAVGAFTKGCKECHDAHK